VRDLRGKLLTQLRRGELDARKAWVLSTDPDAERHYPYHEVVVIDPGRDEVMRKLKAMRSQTDLKVAAEWYRRRAKQNAGPVGIREW
jgi:hypothetical protein